MAKISKEIKMIKKIKKFIIKNSLDGYIIPKNDSYFTEYSNINNLEKINDLQQRLDTNVISFKETGLKGA